MSNWLSKLIISVAIFKYLQETEYPYSVLIPGGIGVGKTTYIENLLKYRDKMISSSP